VPPWNPGSLKRPSTASRAIFQGKSGNQGQPFRYSGLVNDCQSAFRDHNVMSEKIIVLSLHGFAQCVSMVSSPPNYLVSRRPARYRCVGSGPYSCVFQCTLVLIFIFTKCRRLT
jgi:hypothetical protein